MEPEEVLQLMHDVFIAPEKTKPEYIPTGSLGLDIILGGGYRKGSIVELYGDYSTFKTTLAYYAVAQAQKLGSVLWLDSGDGLNRRHLARCGLDSENGVVIAWPRDAVDALLLMHADSPRYELMVVDSAAMLDLDDEGHNDPDVFDEYFGWLDRHLESVVLFVMPEKLNDNPFLAAIRNWADTRIHLVPEDYNRIDARVVKNTGARPSDRYYTRLKFTDGVLQPEYELIFLGLETEVIRWNGSWLYYKPAGEQLGQGVQRAAAKLRVDPRLAGIIQADVCSRLTTNRS